MTKHIRENHENCRREFCGYCHGGLFTCAVCGSSEGELPSECPGRKMSEDEKRAVLTGALNYRDGLWREESNIYGGRLGHSS